MAGTVSQGLHRVSPIKPDSEPLRSLSSVDLPGYELWMTFIKVVYAVPSRLDLVSFFEALSKTTKIYPHVAGRIFHFRDEWKINLTYSDIPLIVRTRDGLQLSRYVVQDDISQFLSTPLDRGAVVNQDTPLLHVKLTFSGESTFIGVSWHHTLGDATMLFHFMRHLSDLYQGLPSVTNTPSFDKILFPEPTSVLLDTYSPFMAHLTDAVDFKELATRYSQTNTDVTNLRLTITGHCLRILRDIIQNNVPPSVNLSVQDCLSAWVAATLSRFTPEDPIRTITIATSYRAMVPPVVDSRVAGNAICILRTQAVDKRSAYHIPSLALAMRTSLATGRKPLFITEYMSAASKLMLDTANTGRIMFFGDDPSVLSVNSQISIHWCSANFGFTDVHFHVSGTNPRYLRVFQANGVHPQDSYPDIEISLGIPSHLKSIMEDAMYMDMRSWQASDVI